MPKIKMLTLLFMQRIVLADFSLILLPENILFQIQDFSLNPDSRTIQANYNIMNKRVKKDQR